MSVDKASPFEGFNRGGTSKAQKGRSATGSARRQRKDRERTTGAAVCVCICVCVCVFVTCARTHTHTHKCSERDQRGKRLFVSAEVSAARFSAPSPLLRSQRRPSPRKRNDMADGVLRSATDPEQRHRVPAMISQARALLTDERCVCRSAAARPAAAAASKHVGATKCRLSEKRERNAATRKWQRERGEGDKVEDRPQQ